ncbi:MAG: mercuric reductase [Planctomycetales bacterium]|nr:mercuric reductase [Planctomycetales bacterium]
MPHALPPEFASLLPRDPHNQRLVEAVHPADWRNPTPADRYHLVVFGGGTAGLVTAAGAAGLGARVALIERELLGGDCLNVGCVPSKALIAAARTAALVRRADEFGVSIATSNNGERLAVDFPAVMQRVRRLRADISPHDSAARFRELGVDVFFGAAAFSGQDTVEVGDATLRFKRAVIATGARPAVPSIPGIDEVDYLTNETLFSLTELPRRLAVLGAGPIGCEMAQAFARLGSEVCLVESTHGILPREDRDAADVVQQAIVRDGVRLLCCGKQMQVARCDVGVRLTLESHDVAHDVTVDRLLVATGRAPNVDGLGLDVVGVEHDPKSGVKVNNRLQTTNPRIYAAGDVCSQYKFTHAADFLARTVIQNALFPLKAKASELVIPWCTYTSPELAHVGLTPQQAADEGVEIDTLTQTMSEVDRAVLDGEEEGFVKVHVAAGTDRILGATVVAAHAGDLIGAVTLAMRNGIGLGRVASTIHPYPTQAEAFRKLGDAYNRRRLTPASQSLLRRWFRWTL